jgi:hypothetical protein
LIIGILLTAGSGTMTGNTLLSFPGTNKEAE